MTKKAMKVSSSNEWRKFNEEGLIVELPSGFYARLVPVSMDKLWATGNIPDSLTSIVGQIISSGQVASDLTPEGIMKDAQRMLELKRVIVEASLKEPKIAEPPNYENQEISYYDLSSEDTEFIMSWAQRPQKELMNFRTE